MQHNIIKTMDNEELVHYVSTGFINEKDPEFMLDLVRELAGRVEDLENEKQVYRQGAKEGPRGGYEFNG